MNLRWIHPNILPWIGLAILPVLIHLFAKARPPILKFSSIQFLREILKTQQRVKRPRDLLLMLLRLLAILILVAVFARPRLLQGGKGNLSQPRRMVVILDTSASMGYVSGGQTRLAVAAAKGARLLNTLRNGDRANVIWMDAEPVAVFPEPGVNISYLGRQMKQVVPTLEHGDPQAAVRLALKQLEGASAGEIVIISDFQATNWKNFRMAIPQAIQLTAVAVNDGRTPNTGLERIRTRPAQPLAGRQTQVLCDLANWGSKARSLEVVLTAGENHVRQDVSLGPFEKKTMVFDCTFPPGECPVVIESPEDEFPPDNRIVGVIPVRKEFQLGVLAGTAEAEATWTRIVNAFPWLRLTMSRTLEEESGQTDGLGTLSGQADILIADGWDGDWNELARFVEDGGALFWCPGPAFADALKAFSPDADASSWTVDTRAAGRRYRLLPRDTGTAVMDLFKTAEFGDLSAPEFFCRMRIPENWQGGGTEILAYGDGTPALCARAHGKGKLIVWNMPTAPSQSTFAMYGEELIQLFGETLRLEAVSSRVPVPRTPGSRLTLNQTVGDISAIRLVSLQGEQVPVRLRQLGSGIVAVSEKVPAPGLYAWQMGQTHLQAVPVVLDPLESDMRSLDAGAIGELLTETVIQPGDDLSWLREGRPLWPALLIALAATLLTEAVVLLAGRWKKRKVTGSFMQ